MPEIAFWVLLGLSILGAIWYIHRVTADQDEVEKELEAYVIERLKHRPQDDDDVE